MTLQHYDLVVIGSGPAGRRAAVQAAKLGRSVLVIERGRRVGGVSVHTGTIPSKTLRETVLNLSGWRERGFYGRGYRVKQDIGADDLKRRLAKTLDHEVEVLEHQFARNGVQVLAGNARFVGPHDVAVTGDTGEVRLVTGERILLAVGTQPYRPADVPFDDPNVFDGDGLLDLPHLPRSLTVVGAGVIGVEYATIFSALDVVVTLVEPRETMLDFLDREIVAEFVHELRDRNVGMRFGTPVASIAIERGRPVCHLADGRRIANEMLLYAAGRIGATAGLDLAAAGLTADARGRIAVAPTTMQTAVPHIYAAGDVIGFPSLASTSLEQGRLAACHAFGLAPPPPPQFFPYGIYAVPEISTIGMTEEEVRAKRIPYEVGTARFRETSRGHIMGLDAGMMKMIFSTATRRLPRRPHHRRGCDRTDPYRSGGAQPEGRDRLFHREHLQLPDLGRGVQDRQSGCMEPDAGRGCRTRGACRLSWWAALAALLFATPVTAQIETLDAALRRDAATWAAVAGLPVGEAEAQLRAQQATISVTDSLEVEFGDRLAGIAVVHRPAYRIDVLLTGDAPAAERTVTAAGLDIVVSFRTGALTTRAQLLAALTAHQAAIRALFRKPLGLGVDQRTGTLAVLVSDADAARFAPDQLEQQLADLAGVPVTVRRLDRTDADVTAEGGARVVGFEADGHRYACTSGFVVTDGARSGLVTAAHCPDQLSFVERDRSETPLPFAGQWGWSFQDVQLHISATPLPPLFFADTARTLERSPTASRPRAQTRVGDVVCHRGERTGYSCAEIAFTDFAPAGDLCGGPCAPSWVAVDGPTCQGGDSGGPVFDGAVALGIVKGASFRPDGSCSLYYYMAVDYLPTGWRVALAPPRPGEDQKASRPSFVALCSNVNSTSGSGAATSCATSAAATSRNRCRITATRARGFLSARTQTQGAMGVCVRVSIRSRAVE